MWRRQYGIWALVLFCWISRTVLAVDMQHSAEFWLKTDDCADNIKTLTSVIDNREGIESIFHYKNISAASPIFRWPFRGSKSRKIPRNPKNTGFTRGKQGNTSSIDGEHFSNEHLSVFWDRCIKITASQCRRPWLLTFRKENAMSWSPWDWVDIIRNTSEAICYGDLQEQCLIYRFIKFVLHKTSRNVIGARILVKRKVIKTVFAQRENSTTIGYCR